MSGHRIAADQAAATPMFTEVPDPGNAGAISVAFSGFGMCPIVSAAAETRTLAAPAHIGQMLVVYLQTDGGDVTLTVADTFNGTGNNTVVFADEGDHVMFVGLRQGATGSGSDPVLQWGIFTGDTTDGSTNLAAGGPAISTVG